MSAWWVVHEIIEKDSVLGKRLRRSMGERNGTPVKPPFVPAFYSRLAVLRDTFAAT
jgi:hypothetical protein